jgi:hypothetical protein
MTSMTSAVRAIQEVNVIIAVGSVDGMAATAACIRHSTNPNIQVVFTQASQVHTINVSTWPQNSKVGFIDLGVNNEGQTPNQQLTIDFVNKIYKSGHTILFIADEHGKKAWGDVLEQCGHSKTELTIKPKDRTKYSSSCAVLNKALGESADLHTKALLHAGDQADQMNYNTQFGEIFNNSTKSNPSDSSRREYVVQYMAHHDTPDAKIQGWMNEYIEIQANTAKIMALGADLGDGIYLYDGTIGRHDATDVFSKAYKTSPVVVLSGTNIFLENKMQAGVSIATNRKDLNVLKIIQEAKIAAGGMPAKANFALKDQEDAIKAVRKAITQQ